MSNWQWKLLRAGTFRLDGGAMFGIIPRVIWSKLSEPDDRNRIALQTNCLLLDNHEGRLVLIETGYGNKSDERSRSIFALENRWVGEALCAAGVDRDLITDVVLTHLHFDHAGGLTYVDARSPTLRSSFPNAVIHVQRREWEDALANKSTMSRTYFRDQLEPIVGQLHLIEGECEIAAGLRVFPVPGHTWGQQAVVVRGAGESATLVFPGDVMPTAAHVGLAYNMAFDVLPYENMQTKRALLTRCLDEGWQIVICHEPGNAIVGVERDPDRPDAFALVPITSSSSTGSPP